MAAAATTRRRRRGPSYDQLPMNERFVQKRSPAAAAHDEWTPRKALRKAGVRSRIGVNQTVRDARERGGQVRGVLESEPTGVGSLLIYMAGTLLALALLENMLGGRGPAAVSKVLEVFGGGIRRLIDANDPLLNAGPAGSAIATTSAPAAAGASTGTRAEAGPPIPSSLKVRFTGASLTGVKPGFLASVAAAAQGAGATIVEVFSAVRSPEHNAAVNGVSGSKHLTGEALDGRAFLPGYGWVPLGMLPTLKANGIRSGNQPGFYNGNPDPNHIDDGA